jgi:hypothetical protein
MMNFSNAPALQFKTLHDPSLSLGGRQILRLTADGWGLLTVSAGKKRFRSFFWGQRQWDLLIPQAADVKAKVLNSFGSFVRVIEIKKNDGLKPDQKFLDDLKPILLKNENQIRQHLFYTYFRSIKLQIKLDLPKIPFFAIRQFQYPRYPAYMAIKNIHKTKNIMTPMYMLKFSNFKIKTPRFMIESPEAKIAQALKFFK